MKVKMKVTQTGADDDNLNVVKLFKNGEEYEVGSDLGGVFIREDWADEVMPTKEVKDAGAPKENKNAGKSPGGKGYGKGASR